MRVDRQALRMLLNKAVELSPTILGQIQTELGFEQARIKAVRQINDLMKNITTSTLEINLPKPQETNKSGCPLYFATVLQSPEASASVFGYLANNEAIPLHDHPGMHGWIRILRGRVQLTSFSWLPADEERQLVNNRLQNDPKTANGEKRIIPYPPYEDQRPVRFESKHNFSTNALRVPGQRQIGAGTDEILRLSPMYCNVHRIEALEKGTAFFDLLIPPYSPPNRDCNYFVLEDEAGQPVGNMKRPKMDGGGDSKQVTETGGLILGDIYWLKEIPVPPSFATADLEYDTIEI